jgi:hypothetical protein
MLTLNIPNPATVDQGLSNRSLGPDNWLNHLVNIWGDFFYRFIIDPVSDQKLHLFPLPTTMRKQH